jgi:hypothetical protein
MARSRPRQDAGRILSRLAPFLDERGALRELRGTLSRAPERLARPVRLAVVGQIKRGKSTLVNAMIGKQLAATGQLETTFRINEFKYGDQESARALFSDRPSASVPLAALASLTVRDPGREAELATLKRVVITLPEPLLRSFELIDTPGLYSVYVTDSANTLELIDPKQAATAASARELDGADAVLYMFSRDLGGADTEVIGRFLGVGGLRSLDSMRTIGIVSKCDSYWPPATRADWLGYNPIETAGQRWVSDYLAAEPELGRLFYEIIPIAGLVAEGAQTIPAEWFNWLQDLADRPPVELLRLLRYRSVFTSDKLAEVALSAQQRRDLDGRLGSWGILLACRYLWDKCGEQEVRQNLVIDSGVQRVRDLTVSHFGTHRYLIKLNKILSDVRGDIDDLPAPQFRSAEVNDQVTLVQDTIEDITDREPGLQAIHVLGLAGQGRLPLTGPELDRLGRLLEPGTSCSARLGRPDGTPPAVLVEAADAEVTHWQRRTDDLATTDPEALAAVRLVLRTAEDVSHRVHEADRLLRKAGKLREKAQLLLD